MTYAQAIILGIVQGLGEFLPISSSAHLVVLPYFFDFKSPGLTFDVALHIGTLISLLAYFYRDWLQLIRAFFRSFTRVPKQWDFDERLIWFILIGTIPAAVAGFFLEDYAETIFRSPALVATMMAVMGTILWLSDRYGAKTKKIEQITLRDAIWIGMAQALALIPGSSRSGITITAGLFRKMDRGSAARFSFLLSTPIVAGAALLKLKDIAAGHINAISITGIVVSAVVGYLAIKYMLYFLQRYSFAVYIWYRILFAVAVFGMLFFRSYR